jgi:uncharacterized membrane protein
MGVLLRRYLIAGLLVWVPLVITIVVVRALVDFMDRSLLLLPSSWRPEALLGYPVPGLGLLLTVTILFVTGLLAANIFGRRIVAIWEGLLSRIPLVRHIYGAVKQVAETVFASNGEAFRRVLLIEYPRKGIWTLAFQTGTASGEVQRRTEAEVLTVFVPTTPNPTSGFIMMIPRNEVTELDMSVEDALKLVVSLGVVAPREIPPSETPEMPRPGR